MPGSPTPLIEVAPLRETLRFYCHALTERSVDLLDLKQLLEKNIGWSKNDVATTDGVSIYLPSIVERFEVKADNLDFLKVMVTQQAGHIEFGSFGFLFDRPATRFDDLRFSVQEPAAYHHHDHGHEGHHERASVTDLTRYFRLFPNRRLAQDIFSIVEAGRVEARIMREYPGIARTYAEMRARALETRPELTLLPAREAILEFMTRLSLGQSRGLKIPALLHSLAGDACAVLREIFAFDSTVEDTAEASLRLYRCLASAQNQYLEAKDFAEFDPTGVRPDRERLDRLPERSAAATPGAHYAPEGALILPRLRGREREYLSPVGVDYRGDFRPELAQLLSHTPANAREQRKALTAEELADLLRSQRTPKSTDTDEEDPDSQMSQVVQNLLRELDRRDPKMQSISRRPSGRADEDGGPLSANQPNTYVYDEWSVFENKFRPSWCKVYEKVMPPGDLSFYNNTLIQHRGLLERIRHEFEQVLPELYRKEKRVMDGAEHDLDAAIEALTDLRAGVSPSEKIFWRQHKVERDVAVAFLMDMSGSTGEAITRASDLPDEERTRRRIIDVEKQAIVLMCDALEAIGDRYGVYGFSGHGRENVEFYVIKDLANGFDLEVAKRLGRIGPLHATRMGPAIRHAVRKLREEQARAKFLFLISDGRPQDRGYSQETSEKEYAVQDTRMALMEARREGIHPFCLTVDKEGNDYLGKMMGDFSYEILADVGLLPVRLPQLYRKLTM